MSFFIITTRIFFPSFIGEEVKYFYYISSKIKVKKVKLIS